MKWIRLIIPCLFFFGFPSGVSAQWVKFIRNPVQAKYRVFETRRREDATHWIYRAARPEDIRKPGEWWVVPNPQLFPKAVTLYRVDRREDADMVVYYVSTRDSASVRLSPR